MANKICIYHGNCADGFGAAYAVWKRFGDDCEFVAGVYQTDPPDVIGKDVILVDFSYKRPVIEEMAKRARTITILDHHKSAAEDLAVYSHPSPDHVLLMTFDEFASYTKTIRAPNVRAFFDMDRSGATITWQYFHLEKPIPFLFRHIEDRDLWKFELECTREIQACVFSHPYDFKTWDWLVARAQNTLAYQDMIIEGEAIERKHHKDIEELLRVVTVRMTIAGHDVPCANLPYTMSSDAGHRLAQGQPFAACYWDTSNGRVFSLRSADDGLDVSEIAKKYGGGGHKHAAGFKLTFGTTL